MVEIGKLFWKKVYTSDNFMLGEIQGAELDTTTWMLTHFYVGLTDEANTAMGFRRPWLGRVTVCLPVSVIESFDGNVMLKETKHSLLKLKECKE